MINEAFEAGKNIKAKLKNTIGEEFLIANKLKSSKFDRYRFCDTYISICIKHNIQNDNDFLIKMLSDDDNYNIEEVVNSICLGLISE